MMRLSAKRDQIPTPMKMTSPPSIQRVIRRRSPPPRTYPRMVMPLYSAPAPHRPSSMGARMATIMLHCSRRRWTGLRWSRMTSSMVPPNFLSSTLPTSTQISSMPRPHAPLCNTGPPSRSARRPVVARLNRWHPLRHPSHPSSPPHPRGRPLTLNQRPRLHQHLTAVDKRRGKHIKSD
jgi:hypothetical protein